MCGNVRSVNEATLAWEGRDWSGVGVRMSTVAVHRSSTASIDWKSESFARTPILLMIDRTIIVRTRLSRRRGCAVADEICGLFPREMWAPSRSTPVTTPITAPG